ncbi:hypothetical protein VNI00_019443 [Paramarasmius palmivorus]|uniref:Uncharacterized protein n=1 Tax=Paramarasmius palmivorus TaxID=297713 RepID=A0AAW0APU1_9AGAR
MSHSNADVSQYDESLLAAAPVTTKQMRQEGYNPDLLSLPSQNTRQASTEKHHDAESRSTNSLAAASKENLESGAGTTPVTHPKPFWRTKKGLVVLVTIFVVIVAAAVVGAVVGVTASNKSKADHSNSTTSLNATSINPGDESSPLAGTASLTPTFSPMSSTSFTRTLGTPTSLPATSTPPLAEPSNEVVNTPTSSDGTPSSALPTTTGPNRPLGNQSIAENCLTIEDDQTGTKMHQSPSIGYDTTLIYATPPATTASVTPVTTTRQEEYKPDLKLLHSESSVPQNRDLESGLPINHPSSKLETSDIDTNAIKAQEAVRQNASKANKKKWLTVVAALVSIATITGGVVGSRASVNDHSNHFEPTGTPVPVGQTTAWHPNTQASRPPSTRPTYTV